MDLSNTRKFTNKLIEQAQEGNTSWESIARAALGYMSESDVEDMATSEELIFGMDEEEDEE